MQRLKSVTTTLLILCLASATAPASAQEHQKQQKHKEAFGVHPVRAVLIETTTEERAKRLMQLVHHPLEVGPVRGRVEVPVKPEGRRHEGRERPLAEGVRLPGGPLGGGVPGRVQPGAAWG